MSWKPYLLRTPSRPALMGGNPRAGRTWLWPLSLHKPLSFDGIGGTIKVGDPIDIPHDGDYLLPGTWTVTGNG